MAALVFAPSPWHFFAFPLVVQWQAHYESLGYYFPNLHFGLLADKPDQEGFTTVLEAPRPKGLHDLKRDYQPGELSQWQAYLDFLATLEHHDEMDLKEVIRGRLEPVLPKQVDRELLWSLAYQLETMLSEEATGLSRLAAQQQALEKVLGEDVEEEPEFSHLDATFNPSLSGGVPDLALAQVRYTFWRQVLGPKLTPPWAALVLEAAAGESSPRYLWEAARKESDFIWQAGFVLPDWRPRPGLASEDMPALHLGVSFRKSWQELLQSLTDDPAGLEDCRQKMLHLVEDQLWPASGLPRAESIRLEVFGLLPGAQEVELVGEPMIFLSRAG